MNEKISLQDLSLLLSEKASITKKEAETFLRTYFEIMNEEIIRSGLLKIKDLGAFKLSRVEDRESIDVTTGERVLIPSHYRVTFSPDKKLAETVNEPFAFFETVEIEEDLEKEEINSKEESIAEEKETVEEKEPEQMKKHEQNNTVLSYKPDDEEELLMENQTDDNEDLDSDDSPLPFWSEESLCPNCQEFEAHRIYRRKNLKMQKKLNQQRIIILILSLLLLCLAGFIIYLYWFENPLPFQKSLSITDVSGLVSKELAGRSP
jgi:nucleoid DNA-binding protein